MFFCVIPLRPQFYAISSDIFSSLAIRRTRFIFLIVGLDNLFGAEDFQDGTVFIFFQIQKRPG